LLQVYNPVLVWANQQFDVKFAVSNSIFGAHQNADTHQAVRQFLQGKQLKISLTNTTKALVLQQCMPSLHSAYAVLIVC
jgi:chaperone required for assembly of F1-ATPase